jgi:hypothetical protein
MRWLRPALLAVVLAAFFAIFAWGLTTTAPPHWIRSCALLFGAIAVFRLMAGFEKGR